MALVKHAKINHKKVNHKSQIAMKTIEELYEKSFNGFKQQPAPKNWENIDKKISKPNFLKFSATSFNIYYLVVIILVVSSIAIISEKSNSTEKILAISKNANLILNNKEINTTNNYKNIITENKTEQIIDNNKTNITLKNTENKNTEIKVISATSNIKEINISETTEVVETAETTAKKLEKRKSQMVANLSISLLEGCVPLTVDFTNKSQNYNSAAWDLENGITSDEQKVTYTYTKPGMYVVSLTITNDENIKKIYDTINVYGKPTAQFDVNKNTIYENQEIEFVNKSEYAKKHEWTFGDGEKSNDENPIHKYNKTGNYEVKLITIAENQCSDTSLFELNVKKDDTKIFFPNAIKPNLTGSSGGYYSSNSNKSSVFCPITEEYITNYSLRIYNKRGILLFESQEINKGWDGYYKNELMPIGVYIYEAKGTFESGEKFYYKGDITLIYSQQN